MRRKVKVDIAGIVLSTGACVATGLLLGSCIDTTSLSKGKTKLLGIGCAFIGLSIFKAVNDSVQEVVETYDEVRGVRKI